ncbi:unnamed protein product, partial [Ectocarpus sp. 4 AP-2014]
VSPCVLLPTIPSPGSSWRHRGVSSSAYGSVVAQVAVRKQDERSFGKNGHRQHQGGHLWGRPLPHRRLPSAVQWSLCGGVEPDPLQDRRRDPGGRRREGRRAGDSRLRRRAAAGVHARARPRLRRFGQEQPDERVHAGVWKRSSAVLGGNGLPAGTRQPVGAPHVHGLGNVRGHQISILRLEHRGHLPPGVAMAPVLGFRPPLPLGLRRRAGDVDRWPAAHQGRWSAWCAWSPRGVQHLRPLRLHRFRVRIRRAEAVHAHAPPAQEAAARGWKSQGFVILPWNSGLACSRFRLNFIRLCLRDTCGRADPVGGTR